MMHYKIYVSRTEHQETQGSSFKKYVSELYSGIALFKPRRDNDYPYSNYEVFRTSVR